MGCDIHAYIEFYDPKDTLCQTFGAECFADGEIEFGRDYQLFGALAGVRSVGTPHIVPKGIPNSPPMSYSARHRYYILVSDEIESPSIFDPYKRIITTEEAERLKKDYPSITTHLYGENVLISNPDYHSASWLTLSEMQDARKIYLMEQIEFWLDINHKKRKQLLNFVESKTPVELMDYSFPGVDSRALYTCIMTMNSLQKVAVDLQTRLVFWFDS